MTTSASSDVPVLSVVIPVRNAEEALESTWMALRKLDPQGSWMEVLVVDGQSEDGTWARLEALQQEELGPRLYGWQRPARGVYDAMNWGAAHAQGRWITFLGAGDIPASDFDWEGWLGDALPDVIQVFGVELLPPREPGVPSHYPARWDRSLWLRHTVHHQGIWYPANLLPLPPFDAGLRVLGDYDLHLHLFQAGLPAQCHPKRWARVVPNGISRQFDWALYREELRIKWRRLSLPVAAAMTPLVAGKWVYKRWKRRRNFRATE